MSWLRALPAILLLPLLPACSDPAGPDGPAPGAVGDLRGGPVDECSGLTLSHQHPGVFWAHNDAGDDPRLYAVELDGETVAEYSVAAAEHVDWEDITADDEGHLYIGDVGNNKSEREDLVVYRLAEPEAVAAGVVAADRSISFRYPDQLALPDPANRFDAEALFWSEGALHLVTKRRSDERAALYRFPNLGGEKKVVLDRLGELALGDAATAAEASGDGQTLAVIGSDRLAFFARSAAGDGFVADPHHVVELDDAVVRQVEALTWDGDAVVFANEQGDIFRLADPFARQRFP